MLINAIVRIRGNISNAPFYENKPAGKADNFVFRLKVVLCA